MALHYPGYPNSAGVPDSISAEAAYANNSDRTYTRRWTAGAASGIITGLNVHWYNTITADMFMVIYRQTNGSGDIIKIGQMDIGDAYTTNQWHGYETAVVVGGESLEFGDNDVLYFGVAHDGATGFGGCTRDINDSTGEVNNQFNNGAVNPVTGPSSPISFSTSGTNKGLCVILRYDDVIGEGGLSIPVAMHHYTKNIGSK